MTLYIIAQLIGFAGYLFYARSPYLKTSNEIIQTDAIACLLISIQWYLLGHPVLLAYSVLSVTASIATLKSQTNHNIKRYLFILYPIGCTIIILMSKDVIITAFVVTAFCCNITSKFSQNIKSLRKYGACSGGMLTVAGILTLSIPTVIFNMLFTNGHITKLLSSNENYLMHKKAGQTLADQPFTQ